MNLNRDLTQEEIDAEIPHDDPIGSTPIESALDPVMPSPAAVPAATAETPKLIGDCVTAPTTIIPIY